MWSRTHDSGKSDVGVIRIWLYEIDFRERERVMLSSLVTRTTPRWTRSAMTKSGSYSRLRNSLLRAISWVARRAYSCFRLTLGGAVLGFMVGALSCCCGAVLAACVNIQSVFEWEIILQGAVCISVCGALWGLYLGLTEQPAIESRDGDPDVE